MFPDKTRMVKIANLLLLQLAIAPVIFIVVAFLLELGGASLATNPGFVLQVLFVLILLSLASNRDYRFRSNQQELDVRKGTL